MKFMTKHLIFLTCLVLIPSPRLYGFEIKGLVQASVSHTDSVPSWLNDGFGVLRHSQNHHLTCLGTTFP
jgi:hypothetical protein